MVSLSSGIGCNDKTISSMEIESPFHLENKVVRQEPLRYKLKKGAPCFRQKQRGSS